MRRRGGAAAVARAKILKTERHFGEMIKDTDAFVGQHVLRHVSDQALGTSRSFAVIEHVRCEHDAKLARLRRRVMRSQQLEQMSCKRIASMR